MSHEILTPAFERNDERGLFREVLNDGTWEALLWGRMNPKNVMGNHYHKKTLVFFYLTSGSAMIKTVHVHSGQREEFSLTGGQGVLLKTNEAHAIHFLEETEFVMLKSLKYDPADPDTYHLSV